MWDRCAVRRTASTYFVVSTLLLAASCTRKSPDGSEGKDQPTLAPASEAADTVVYAKSVLTMDPANPEVEAIAIDDGVIVAVGERESIAKRVGENTQVLDLATGSVTPGLVDAHAHLLGLGRQFEVVDLKGLASIDAVVKALEKGAPEADGRWVLGRGWDQNLWAEDGAMPDHQRLTEAFPDRPVWLTRIDGHAGWANQTTLERAGITNETPDPPGGEILRDEEGAATGVLIDSAMELVPVPPDGPEDIERHLLAAIDAAVAAGLTGVHEMGLGKDAHVVLESLADTGRLKLRVEGYASQQWFADELGETAAPPPPSPDARYHLHGVKIYADGALGSRGAALHSGYTDRLDHRGMLITGAAELETLATKAMANGWQAATHAIGDRANRLVLDAYQAAHQRHARKDHRFRIEHAQIVTPTDVPEFAKLGIIASMQPTHATSDMPWAGARLGDERLAGAYAWRSFADAGVRLAFGSDFPVESVEPTLGLYSAITRQDADGEPPKGWHPEQRVSLQEAIAAFTRGAAYAVHREEHFGRIAVGMQADLTGFVIDISDAEPTALRTAGVEFTMVGGDVVFRQDH